MSAILINADMVLLGCSPKREVKRGDSKAYIDPLLRMSPHLRRRQNKRTSGIRVGPGHEPAKLPTLLHSSHVHNSSAL